MEINLLALISDPVRLALVRSLAGSDGATAADLAQAAGVHPNTARVHLAELEQAGALAREQAPSGLRGRPRQRYRLRAGWRLPTSDMLGLAELLAALALRLDPSEQEIEQLGRQWGRYLAGRPAESSPGRLTLALEQLGFDAELAGGRLKLSACPCPLVAPDRPQAICRLVQAVVEGFLDMSDRPMRIIASRRLPAERTCNLTLAGDLAPA